MEGYLTDNQIEYVFFHLGQTFPLDGKVRELMDFRRGSEPGSGITSRSIVFEMTDQKLDGDSMISIGDIPVLFPVGTEKMFYSFSDQSLIFHHDLLKSCFYLLSGYQELEPVRLDALERFSYEDSIQKKGNFVHRPLVNEYFEIIFGAIREFASIHRLHVKQISLFRDWAFFLSHDVDRLDTYTWYEAGYWVKQLAVRAPSSLSRRERIRITSKYLAQCLKPGKKENPHWDFDFLHQLEEAHGFRSTYFFLPEDQLHMDAYYRFDEPRVVKLMGELDRSGNEIGIHGTVRSAGSKEAMLRDIERLKKHSPQEVRGIRQHRLHFDRKVTHHLHEEAGLWYDTTLGFAQHEGFRNSYCLPFRPYDHQQQRMMDIWEIPLVVMDVTLFQYRSLNFGEALQAIELLLNEIIRFHGVFSLLWHNGQGDEFMMPGIRGFLSEMLKMIAARTPESLLGHEIVQRCENKNEVL